jgi:hypothetical protein
MQAASSLNAVRFSMNPNLTLFKKVRIFFHLLGQERDDKVFVLRVTEVLSVQEPTAAGLRSQLRRLEGHRDWASKYLGPQTSLVTTYKKRIEEAENRLAATEKAR